MQALPQVLLPSAFHLPDRSAILGHGSAVLWLTGLSGSGKSTLARALEARLLSRGILATVIDGDELRGGLSQGLGFSPEDRRENIRRATELALHLGEAGLVAIVALISPLGADRDRAARRIRARGVTFAEVYINSPLDTCEHRDVKGLYLKARRGEIPGFTGIDAPYEPPATPGLELHTDRESVGESVAKLTFYTSSLVRRETSVPCEAGALI